MKPVNILDVPRSPVTILVEQLGVSEYSARQAIISILKEGWCLAPVEPSNSMLVAYAEALSPPQRLGQIASSFGKARRRWRAMALEANKLALSPTYAAAHEGGNVDATKEEK